MFDKALEQVQRRNKAFEQIEKLTEIEIQAIKLRNYPMLFRYLLPYCLQLEEIFENLAFPFEAYNRRSKSDILEVVNWFDDYVTNKIKTDYITIFKEIAEWTDSEERDFSYNMAEFLIDEKAEDAINEFFHSLKLELKKLTPIQKIDRTISLADETHQLFDSKGLWELFKMGFRKNGVIKHVDKTPPIVFPEKEEWHITVIAHFCSGEITFNFPSINKHNIWSEGQVFKSESFPDTGGVIVVAFGTQDVNLVVEAFKQDFKDCEMTFIGIQKSNQEGLVYDWTAKNIF